MGDLVEFFDALVVVDMRLEESSEALIFGELAGGALFEAEADLVEFLVVDMRLEESSAALTFGELVGGTPFEPPGASEGTISVFAIGKGLPDFSGEAELDNFPVTLNFVPPGASEVICGEFGIGVGEVDFSGDELTVAEADNFAFPLYFEPLGACEGIFFVFAILLQPISNQTQKFLLLGYLMQIKDHREK